MSIFKLPVWIIKQTEKLQLNFLRQGNEAMTSLEVVGIFSAASYWQLGFWKGFMSINYIFFCQKSDSMSGKGDKIYNAQIWQVYGMDMTMTWI